MTHALTPQTRSPAHLDAVKSDIEASLTGFCAGAQDAPSVLEAAISHSLLAPGKRFRPLLTAVICQDLTGDHRPALVAGCAAEMVHTASLILDDLPCMDDAPLRRSKSSSHVEFGEATAILAAVALLNRAFGAIAGDDHLNDNIKTQLCSALSHAIGSHGLIAGQLADLANHDAGTDIVAAERINALKTGALIDFSVKAGCLISGADAARTQSLMAFSHQIGLAFQLLDDFKDVFFGEAQTGKTSERDKDKETLIALEGKDAAKARLRGYMNAAYAAIDGADLGSQSQLRQIVERQFSALKVI